MKNKLFAMIALLTILTLGVSAMAEGQIALSNERYTLDDEGEKAYVFALAENIGDKAMKLNDASFELLDKDGKVIEDTESVKAVADYLQPGERSYVYAVIDLEDVEGEIADHRFSIKGKENDKYTSVRLSAACELDPEDSDTALVTVTNDTDEVVYGVKGAVTFLDGEENIVAINSVSMLSKVGLNPGSSVTMKVGVPSDFEDAAKAIGMKNLTLDAVACADVKN